MNREVLRPRRSMRWFYALCFVTGCATAITRHAVHNDRIGSDVPPSVWRGTAPSSLARPALLCIVNREVGGPVFTGSYWHCPEFGEGLEQ